MSNSLKKKLITTSVIWCWDSIKTVHELMFEKQYIKELCENWQAETTMLKLGEGSTVPVGRNVAGKSAWWTQMGGESKGLIIKAIALYSWILRSRYNIEIAQHGASHLYSLPEFAFSLLHNSNDCTRIL